METAPRPEDLEKELIHWLRSSVNSRPCAEDATRGFSSEPVNAGIEVGGGCRIFSLRSAKLLTRRDGTPAVRDQYPTSINLRSEGRDEGPSVTMKRSHGDFGWRRAGTESWVGVMIQRITLAIMRGLRDDEERAERKRDWGTEEESETRWRMQAGMVN
jgi:hypothetical protein